MSMTNIKQLKILREPRPIDFAETELSPYLDKQRGDAKGFKQFKQTAEKRKEYKDRVDAGFGSLSKSAEPYNSGHTSGWDAGPWPWQVIPQT
ncbi:hypothetical protein SD71_05670 [Cohnella kolymensis]|uniref:Protein CotJB domain-containing protein n=1 Tax=Cohnella kolymensis TaxID=1590652 RepID=A0ABR5A8G1_9BACL|nr:spore coat protein CotJB [Cohnella kolymensis]KIL36880.1 hypothetical protein SD71_05670 [Cohnella kolymensis]